MHKVFTPNTHINSYANVKEVDTSMMHICIIGW